MPARFASKFAFCLFILTLVSLSLLNVYTYYSSKPEVIVIDTANEDITFWETIKQRNPTYRDAYLVLSQIKAKEGDVLGARTLINSALEVDPFGTLIQLDSL